MDEILKTFNEYGLAGVIILALFVAIAFSARSIFEFVRWVIDKLMTELAQARELHRVDMQSIREAHAKERNEWQQTLKEFKEKEK